MHVMKSFIHSFRLTFRRFRWEILGFWILSVGVVSAFAGGLISTPRPFRPAPDFARLEMLAACWLILRLMFSEPVFLTQGGWRTRPISARVAHNVPFAVLAVVLLPALLVRVICMALTLTPDAPQWDWIAGESLLRGVVYLGLVALLLRLAGSLLPRRGPGIGRKIAFTAVGLLALGAWFHPRTARMFAPPGGYSGNGFGGQRVYDHLIPGLSKVLPPGTILLNKTEHAHGEEFPRMKEILRLVPARGMRVHGSGFTVEVKRVEPRGRNVQIDLEFEALNPDTANLLSGAAILLRYPGNVAALRQGITETRRPYPLFCYPVASIATGGEFEGPGDKPDWEALLPALELVIYGHDREATPITDWPKEAPPEPEKPFPVLPPGIEGEVLVLFNGIDDDRHWQKRGPLKARAQKIPREAMPHVLARHPWSDSSWEVFVRPFLIKHAVEADKPALLARMETEPRLTGVFAEKGWKADAMPLLRRFGKERLPLGIRAVKALAEERDPDLAADVAALAARLEDGAGELEPLLREHPGLDWAAFVHDGWLRRKYSFRRQGPVAPFDRWAAQSGDPSAFRYIAEKAARREKGYQELLKSLAQAADEDVVGWVRKNIATLKFDPGTGKWGL